MNDISRRKVLLGAAATTLLDLSWSRPSRAQAAGPIRIGVGLPLSGPLAVAGRNNRVGAELAAAEVNRTGGVGGRTIELTFLDDKGDANQAAATAREWVGSGNNLMVAGFFGHTFNAVLPVLKGSNALMISGAGFAMPLTHELFTKNMFRGIENDRMRVRALARLAAEKYPDVTEWAGWVLDLESYVASYRTFSRNATEEYAKLGKKVTFALDPIRFKLGSSDFKTQISSLMSTPTEGLFNLVFGQDAATLWQQAATFGLQKKIKVVIDQGNEYPLALALKKNLPRNFWTPVPWYPGRYNTPEARALLDAASKALNTPMPTNTFFYGYLPVIAFAHGIRTANGATDTDTLIRTLEGLSIPTPRGPVYFRKEDHQLIQDVTLINMSPADNELGFAVVDSVAISGESLVEPPSPGQPYVE